MTPSPASKSVLITGASTGFGKLAAVAVARAGHRVYAGIRDQDGKNREASQELRALAGREDLHIRLVDLDVTSPLSLDKAVEHVLTDAGRIDVLVNNAGHMSIGIAEGFTEEQVRRQMEVNFFGPVHLSRAVLPHMRAQRSGLIVHVTSIVGRVLFPACAFYCASKFALEAYAEVLHYELTGLGIDSVIVQPGPFPTNLLANSPGPDDRERVDAYGPLSSIREQFAQSFHSFFQSSDAPTPKS